MHKTLTAFVVILFSLTVTTTANAEPIIEETVGVEAGEHAGSEYVNPNTKIEVKQNPLWQLAENDMVVVSTESNAVKGEAETMVGFKKVFSTENSHIFLLTKQEALTLQNTHPQISVEPAAPVSSNTTTQTPTPSWGLDVLDSPGVQNGSYIYRENGEGVTIYVVDGGIDPNVNDFGGRVQTGYTYYDDEYGTGDCDGHGTAVAALAAGATFGVAKASNIVPVRVANCEGDGTNLSIIAGLDWIANTHPGGPAVINMSLGGAANASINIATEAMIDAGFTVVAAAGNTTEDACNVSPAMVPEAITVAAITSSYSFASFSNHGSCIDITAPGVNINTALFGTTSGVRAVNGTSYSAPFTAGVAATLLELNPNYTPAEIATIIDDMAIERTISGLPVNTTNKTLTTTIVQPKAAIWSNFTTWDTTIETNSSLRVFPNNAFTTAATITVSGVPSGVTETVTGFNIDFAGKPTMVGTYIMFFTISEGKRQEVVSKTVNIKTTPTVTPSFTITPGETTFEQNQTVNTTYTVNLNSAYSTTPTLRVFNLPEGLTASITDNIVTITGTPTTVGGYKTRINVTDNGQTKSSIISTTVTQTLTPEEPTPTVTKTGNKLTATINTGEGSSKTTMHVIVLKKNGATVSTTYLRNAETTEAVIYNSINIPEGSGNYVLEITAKNNAGPSTTNISEVYAF